jgi:hypothetical protein
LLGSAWVRAAMSPWSTQPVLNAAAMTRNAAQAPSLFTAPERDLIRREFARHFGAFPSLADGIFLRTWRAGPQAGQPKLPPAVRSMLERGLVESGGTLGTACLARSSPRLGWLSYESWLRIGALWIPCALPICGANSGCR